MSWYASEWSHRIPILCDNLVAGTAAVDITFSIPGEVADFWDNVRPTGNDIRVTIANGTTIINHQLVSFNSVTRTGSIEIESWTPALAQSLGVIWVYVGNAAASAASTPFVASTPRNGYVTAERPSGGVLHASRIQPGKTDPSMALTLTLQETIKPWVVVTQMLGVLESPYEGHTEFEEVEYITQTLNEAGVDVPTAYAESDIRMAGTGAIRTNVIGSALTSGDKYTLSMAVGTSEGRILNPRVKVYAKNVDEL